MKMKNLLCGVLGTALAGFALVSCSSEGSSEAPLNSSSNGLHQNSVAEGDSTVIKVDSAAFNAVGLWKKFAKQGVAEYFDSVTIANDGVAPIDTSVLDNGNCPAPALSADENTLYFDEMENLYLEGHLVDGVCGKALSLKSGQVAPLGMNLVDSMETGTVEFWFRPGEDFYDETSRTLLGNDEARIHFFVRDGKLIFQKNHADQHFFVEAEVELKADWNKIAGQWGDGYMSLWLNDSLVARKVHSQGYAPSLRGRPFGNLLVVGFKTYCCMEPTGQHDDMTTSGDYDQVRISKIARYENKIIEQDSSILDTLTSPEVTELSSSSEFIESSASMDSLLAGETSNCLDLNCKAQFDELTVVPGDIVKLPWVLEDSIDVGAMSFKFKAGDDFYEEPSRVLIGNDEGRLLFYFAKDSLFFAKNGSDVHYEIAAKVDLNEWTEIVGQWGRGEMSLYVNGEKVAFQIVKMSGYMPSPRSYEGNRIVIGEKSSCCMESASRSLTTTGSFKDIAISDWIYDVE